MMSLPQGYRSGWSLSRQSRGVWSEPDLSLKSFDPNINKSEPAPCENQDDHPQTKPQSDEAIPYCPVPSPRQSQSVAQHLPLILSPLFAIKPRITLNKTPKHAHLCTPCTAFTFEGTCTSIQEKVLSWSRRY